MRANGANQIRKFTSKIQVYPPVFSECPASVPDWPVICLLLMSIDSQRSHLSSFTMKLMDKFHSPKIKRTPSKKGKQLQPEPAAKSTEKPANKVCVCSSVYVPEKNVCIVGSPPLSHLILCVCLTVCETIVFLFRVWCYHTPLCLCVQVPLLVPTASQTLWQLTLLPQVSKLIQTWMELGRFLNELHHSLLRRLV